MDPVTMMELFKAFGFGGVVVGILIYFVKQNERQNARSDVEKKELGVRLSTMEERQINTLDSTLGKSTEAIVKNTDVIAKTHEILDDVKETLLSCAINQRQP